ncbi:MAG: cyclase family protein [Mycobacterium sp.]
MAERVRTWGRWGAEDELGTLNFITAAKLVEAASMVRTGKLFPLGVNLDSEGPQGASGSRRNPIHLMILDGNDQHFTLDSERQGSAAERMVSSYFQRGPARWTDDYVMMPLQAATQWDALAHAYYDGQLYNGYPASSISSLGAARDSIDKVDRKGIVSRGVLLDVARHRGLEHLPPLEEIQPEELDAVAEAQGVMIRSGDIVLIRTGWWQRFILDGNGPEWMRGCPGVHWRVAEWLYDRDIAAVAADNTAVEAASVPEADDMVMPFHLLCLRDMVLMLGEMWNLEELSRDCAEDGVYEFQLIAPPLRVTGAVGSPLNPIAIK